MLKNNKKFNQILSLFLVFCMLFSCFPNIFAQGEEQDEYYTNYYDSTYIEKVWDDAGHESERPSSIDLIFWGTNDYEDSENFQNGVEAGRITLTSANETSDTTWTYTDPLSLVYFEYYYLTEEMPESSPYEMVDSFVNTEINEQSISAYSLGNILGAEITNKYVDNSKLVKFNIEKIWDDTGYEDIRPTSITVEIYGTNTENSITDGEKIGELTITGNSSTNKWTATTETIETNYDYFYIVENTMNNYSATIIQPTLMEPVPVSTTNVEPSNNNVSPLLEENNNALIKAEEIENADTSETFSFMVSKMWVEPINLLNERAESITFNLYQNNEKIDSLTMTAEDADDDMTWINSFANKYPKYDENGNPYEYRIEEEKSETTTGVPYLATFDENINSIATLDDENNTTQIITLSNQRFPYVTIFEVIKEWKDEGFESERPSNITIAIYLDSDKNGTPDTYLSEVDLNSSNVDPDNSNKWVSFALIPIDEFDLDAFEPEHIYLVEDTTTSEINLLTEIDDKYVSNIAEIKRLDPDYLPDELHPSVGSLMPDWLIEYNDVSYRVVRGFTSTVINKHIDQYTAKITNRFVPEKEHIQFKINKIWEDNNNEHNLRPSSIQVEIYGTNTAGATEGGELLDTVTLTNTDISDASGENTWTKLSNSIETNYNYFYAKEINGPDTYTSVISPIVKAEDYSLVRGEDLEEPNPYIVKPFAAWGGYDYDVNVRVHKLDENGNYLPGATLIMNDIDEDYGWQLDEWTTTNTYHESWFYACAGGGIGYEYQEIMPWYIMEREAPEGYQTINPIEIAWEDIFPEDVTNAREAQAAERAGKIPPSGTMVFDLYIVNRPLNAPELYEVNITNTVIPPARDVQFDITKTWNDNNDEYYLRPLSIDLEIYGVETEGATTGGTLLDTITLTFNDKIDANTWKKTTDKIETNYQYFYVKEINSSSSYTATISPVEKVTSFTTIVNNLQNNSGIAPLAGFEDFIYLNKIWDDNNNEKGKRPESIIINAYTDEAKTDLYFSLELTETTCTMLEDPYGLDLYGYGGWTAEGIFFSGAPDVPELYIEEVCDNYVSSAVVTIEESEEMMGTDTTITITNTYVENPPELYEVNVTNTVIPPERDVQFKINKVWDDQDNRFNERGPISIEVFGTNTEGATTNGTSLGSFTITESDSTGTNTWSKTSPVYSTNFKYFYIVETFNNASYTSTISPLTKLDPPDPSSTYSREPISNFSVMFQTHTILVEKIWEDNDNAAGKRPEFIEFNVYYNENEDNYDNKQLYLKARLYEDNLEIIEDPTGCLYAYEGEDWQSSIDSEFEHSEWFFWVEEVPVPNYVAEEVFIPGMDPYDRTSTIGIINTYYVETYEATITNTYIAPIANVFNISKVWADQGNLAGLRPEGIKIEIYGTNTPDTTTGGELLKTTILNSSNANSENDSIWEKQIVVSTTYNYFYVVETSLTGEPINSYTLTKNTVTKTGPEASAVNTDKIMPYVLSRDNLLTIYKIWEDNDNILGLRPQSIILTIYQNSIDDEATKQLLAKVKLYNDHLEFLEIDNNYITDNTTLESEDWMTCLHLNDTVPSYLWVEEEPSALYNMTYYKDYGLMDDINLFVTNTIKSVNTYNVELVNTVNIKHINFNITKTWDDFNNFANIRPDSIKVQIYGTNTEGTTTGGELIETVELTNQNETAEDTNVWNKSVTISSNYNYFYIKEIAADGSEINSYVLTQNTLTKVDLESQSLANRPSTYAGISDADILYVEKYWNDNDNALGLRPDSITLKIYKSNTDDESTKQYLDTIELTEEDEWFTGIYVGRQNIPEYLWVEEINTSNNYNMEYLYIGGYLQILNTINNVDFYNVELTNTMDLNFVNFNITKTWEDQNNIFGLRPSSIDIEIYGTNTQGATTGGELIQTVTLRSTDVSESDSNKWELTTPMIATEYDYFYIKEANVPSAYAVSISALTKINTQDQGNEAEEQSEGLIEEPITSYKLYSKYFAIILSKTWNDNDNAANMRPEYVDFNIWYNTEDNESGKQLYGKVRVYEETFEILEDPIGALGEGDYNSDYWEAGISPTFEHYSYYYWIEELPIENYTSDLEYDHQAFCWVDEAYELWVEATNTYIGPEVDSYNVEITNTLEVQTYNIEINKVWDDDGFENVRPEEIVVKIYGTNNQTDATNKINGTLIGQTTLTSDENWMSYDSFQSMDNFTYIYAVEELPENSIDYIVDTDYVQTTFVPQGRIVTGGGEGPDTDTGYSAELTITNIAPDKKINIIKEWDDNNQVALRPATISVSILQNGELFRVVTLSAADNWKLTDIEVPRFDENGNEYVYSLQESIPEGYSASYSEKQAYNGPVRIKFTNFKFFEEGINDFIIIYEKDGNYYSMHISDTPVSGKFELDSNNCIEIPSPNFYVYYGWGYTSGSQADFAIESIEKIESTTNQGTYVDNINGLGLENAPEVTDITDIKLDFSGLDIESDEIMWKYVAFAENALIVTNSRETETRLTITKIWVDDNNMYFTRPDSLDITVYQNGVVYRVLTFTNMNADINNSNVWKSTISVPMYDANGNECIYTISEDESNLFLDYYYYEPYINQNTLTATNVGIWLPPIDIDMNDPATYTIVLGKEILNENDEIATEEDFWKLKLNIDDTYEFPIVLKEMNRTISRGETGMLETYGGYTGNTFKGVLTNKGQLVFTNLQPGKYEISEIVNQYFDFVGMETIYASDGASLTCEDGKYYIELSGVTEVFEEISVKVINKLEDERPFNDLDSKDNLYYVSSREQIEEIAQEMLERDGMTGRLYIPDVNYDVALFEVSASDGAANQRVTDKSDSAAFMKWGQQWLVADHYYQGFDKMKNAKPGTIAYINNGERIQAYICTEKAAGENVSYTLLDNKGNDLYDRNAGGICMYTCNVVIYNGQDITYSLWQPIN